MPFELPDYVGEPYRDRLRKVMKLVNQHLPEEAEDVFVSNYSEDNESPYREIWLFTKHLIVEIRNPLNSDRIQHELAPFNGAVDWIRLIARKYEFEDPESSSELDLEFSTTDGHSGTLSATGQGCRALMQIYQSRFLQNFTGTHDELES